METIKFLKNKKIFLASAWPYGNNSLHLGHIACLIGADILKKFFSLKGNKTLWVSGTDCYGTPIAIEAQLKKKKPKEIVAKFHKEFKETFKKLDFSFDFYSQTLSKKHHQIVKKIFLDLLKKGLIYQKTQKQFFCPKCQRFLADRFIEGICPFCKKLARGDQCDYCGQVLDPKNLINPYCRICGSSPILKETTHFFFKLSQFRKPLISWIKKQKLWRKNALEFSLNFLKKGLVDRAITRDLKWGVRVPLKGFSKKVIYVWFEAVCGYLSASIEFSEKIKKPNFWKEFFLTQDSYHYYFLGKDNIFFHTVIWPAILMTQGLHLPDQIVSSEYLLLEGKKFSKSRNWLIEAKKILEFFEADLIRFYLIRINPQEADSNFSFSDFYQKINKELIANFGNYCHRTLNFVFQNFKGEIFEFKKPSSLAQVKFYHFLKNSFFKIQDLMIRAFFKEALEEVLKISIYGNKFLNETMPWKKIKNSKKEAKKDLELALFSIEILRNLIYPFLPSTSKKLSLIFKEKNFSLSFKPKKIKILKKPQLLFKPLKEKEVKKIKEKILGSNHFISTRP